MKMASAVLLRKRESTLKKILLVLTGGTICTSVNAKGVRAIHQKTASLLQQGFMESDSVYRNEVTFDTTQNFGILSENMTPEKWNELVTFFRSIEFGKGYNGIVIAHGTDTLGFSAPMLSLLFAGKNIPVFLVSSNLPLEQEQANGHINFRTAVECICKEFPANVYVPYRNQNRKLFLHFASRLQQCSNYSDDFFSVGAMDITRSISTKVKKQVNGVTPIPCVDDHTPFAFNHGILWLHPYVGLNYQEINLQRVKAVLHGTYHSGTVCAQITEEDMPYNQYSVLTLLDRCQKENIPVIFAPAKVSGEVYESVPLVAGHKGQIANFVYGCTPEMAYVKLMLGYALGKRGEDLISFMQTDFAGEFFASLEKGEES